jgi:methionine synthase II (cobalamin-independent)
MANFEPACLATAIGSLPLTDPRIACGLVLRCFPEIPGWPQLPGLSFRESMHVQFSEGLPGAVMGEDGLYVDVTRLDPALERLYLAYLGDSPGLVGSVTRPYAEGFSMFLSMRDRLGQALALKGQVTGPISMGLQITDRDRRPILYNEIVADALAKLLRLKAVWQEDQLHRICSQTIIFVDEPYLSKFGSADLPVSREQVVTGLEEVFGGIQGLKGLHCCGNTDWSMLMNTSVDVLSFDAYNYAVPFSLCAGDVKAFLGRGGIIAWGIVPNDAELLREGGETTESLAARLMDAMALLAAKGVSRDLLLQRALITTSCGLGTLSVADATRACELTSSVSALVRARAGLV